MTSRNNLRVCSFNCCDICSSVYVLQELCELCDFHSVHWLLPFDLEFLNNVHDSWLGFSNSAVDTSTQVLIGRPFGGIAILCEKNFQCT